MRIFISDVSALIKKGESKSKLVRALLRYAVRQVWDVDCPEIDKTEKGKPYFPGHEGMHFSLSHSKKHVLAALSEHDVGADVETLREVRQGAERLFSKEMLDTFGYFGGWVLRESVYKLTNEGRLRTMDIKMTEDDIATPFEGVRCRLYENVPGCTVAAACYEGNFPEKIEIVEAERFWT